jgi:4-hydroxy-tetrahydrodipicolinate synthase
MTAFDPRRLRTVHLVPLTAFDGDGRVNTALQSRHVAEMAAAGVRVFLPSAGTSEFHNLTMEENLTSVRLTREQAPDAVVFAAVGGPIGTAVTLAERAANAGADAILFMPLTHPYLSDAGVLDYVSEVLKHTSLPAVLYKNAPIPSDRLLLKLLDNPRIIGFKYAVNDLAAFQDALDAAAGRGAWICGSAERFAPYYMLAGSPGYTTGAGNLCPRLTLAMHAAIARGDWSEGMRLQRLILPIEACRARDGSSYNISMLKYAMTRVGKDFGPPRPPQRRLTPDDCREVDRLLEPILAAERELQPG